MIRLLRLMALGLLCVAVLPSCPVASAARRKAPQTFVQETGFLNRKLQLHGTTYRFQVYLPDEWRADDGKQWPVILFLHGREERGSDGLWQTQIGLPQAVRDHPERWPFVIVMPQCPLAHYWTDAETSALAMAALDQESREFHTDPKRTYLAGISLGGYGAWELAKLYPKRWAAMIIASGGIFWSYATDRWQQVGWLPKEYASTIGNLPIWLFHGSDDSMVVERQSELMADAFKSTGGRLRLWVYQGVQHDSWTRGFNEPDLPRWLLSRRQGAKPEPAALYERVLVPLHPAAIKLSPAQLDALVGDYAPAAGSATISLTHQGDRVFLKDARGDADEIAPETPTVFFYPNSLSPFSRLIFEHDAQGRITGAFFHSDRREEHWEKRSAKP